jgi:solute carrier family 25 (adenine nucleotide translocator) protein 4/5/6/31
MADTKPRKVKLSFMEDFLLSGTAAVTSKTIAAPIERIKMVVQNQDEMLKRGTLDRPFKGIIDCGNWIVKNEGFGAFWRSNFTNCIRYFPTQALNFAFKGQIKPYFKGSKEDSKIVSLTKNVAAGGLAGGGSLAFVYSLDYARTRLANDLKATKGEKAGKREFNGIIDVYRKTLASDGIVGLYRGFVISFVGIFIYRGFYFGLYDTIVEPLGQDTSFAIKFVVGYAVTVIAGVLSYPIDTIRRRMIMTSGGSKELMYKSSMDCAVKIMKAEGFTSFFKGAGANILRGVAGAGVLSGFDEFKKFYIKSQYGENCYA